MKGFVRAGLMVLMMALLLDLSAVAVPAQEPGAQAPTTVDIYKNNDKGILIAEVKFAANGTVATCRITRSNVPYALEAGTVDYIKHHWVNTWFANYTVRFPVVFDELPWNVTHWDNGFVPPPNFLQPGDPGRRLKLRVTFGPEGWVKQVSIQEPSGIQLVDQQTAVWVKVHWHAKAYAGKTLDAPFVFKSLPVPKPIVAKAPPPPPKPAPVAPAEPAEPAATPAVRVE